MDVNTSLPIANEVQQRLSRLLPPRDAKAAEALADMGTLAIKPLEEQLATLRSGQKAHTLCIGALALMKNDRALHTLARVIQAVDKPNVDTYLRIWAKAADPERYAQLVLAPLFHKVSRTELRLFRVKSLKGLQYLTMLEELHLEQCANVDDMSPLAGLHRLKVLKMKNGLRVVRDVSALATLTALEEIDLEGCGKITSVAPLIGLSKLRKLNLNRCERLRNLEGIANKPDLEELHVSGCPELVSTAPLTGVPGLKILDMSDCFDLQEISSLANLRQLEQLDLRGCRKLGDTSSLSSLQKLRALTLTDIPLDLDLIANMRDLEKLYVDTCYELKNVHRIGQLPKLQSLHFHGPHPLSALPLSLQELTAVSYCHDLVDFTLFRGHPNLCRIKFGSFGADGLSYNLKSMRCNKDLSGLADLPQLRELTFAGCQGLERLHGLENLPSLQKIHIERCLELTTIRDLSHLTSLREIYINSCPRLQDVTGLTNLPQLQTLTIQHCPGLQNL